MMVKELFKRLAKPSPFSISLGAAGATLLLTSCFVALTFQSGSDNLLSVLIEGQPFAQQVAGRETHYHRIAIGSRKYLHLLLGSTNLNLKLTLLGPDSARITEQVCPSGKAMPVSLITEVAGEYVLKIQPQNDKRAPGNYTLRLADYREAKPEDRNRVAAESLIAEGKQLAALESSESLRTAIKKYEQALNAWETVGDQREQAGAYRAIADIYDILGESQQALNCYQKARQISQSINDFESEGEDLNGIGYAHLTLSKNHKAWEVCLRALELNQCSGNRRAEAQSLNNLGEILYDVGKRQDALKYYQQAIAIWRDLADERGQAQTLLNFGYTYSDLGEPGKALDFDQQALDSWKAVKSNRGQALTLTAIGRVKSRLGESQEAIRFFNQAMQLARLVGDQTEEARILNGLGYVQESLGEQQKAIEYYKLALHLFRTVNYPNGEASTYNELGRAYFSLEDMENSLDYFDRGYRQSSLIGDTRLEAYALRGLGMVYDFQGNKAKALETYRKALPVHRAEKDRRGEAVTLNLIGRIYHSQGSLQAAIEHYKKALALNQAAGDRNRESLTLYNVACAERDRGKFDVALSQIETSLGIVESLRTKVASRELRTSYFATIQQYYQLNIDLLMQRQKQAPDNNFATMALEINERARARSLLDILGEDRINIRASDVSVLVQRLRKLQQEIAARSESRMQLLGANNSLGEVTAITKEIAALTSEREKIELQISSNNPHYAALTQPRPLSAQEIQQIVDGETVLLEFSLGEKRSYVWVVTPAGVKGIELPSRAEIERAAQDLYEVLAPKDSAPVQLDVRRTAEYWKRAIKLSQLILTPLAKELSQKRVVIVADGFLQYIPFGALPKPPVEKRQQAGNELPATSAAYIPLIQEHEVVSLPSASTLAVLRREMAGRRSAPKAVAVLADPVFEASDLRLLAINAPVNGTVPNQAAIGDLTSQLRNQAALRSGIFKRLHGTSDEAKAIEEWVRPEDRFVAKGFEANLQQATSADLSQYRIIHLATHGVLDDKNPDRSALVFSLFDKQGKSQEGRLWLHDIYNLNLPAELVVLSACDTGLGKEFKGEGLVGLTRGFMYAGAPRVMASLWKVEDKPTAMLMRRFYWHLLKMGLPPAAALRQAQLDLSKDPDWNAPYYWGSFVLQGEWR